MISARIADRMGFPALYATGFGTIASYLGLPDVGLATYTDMVARMGTFARGCRTPVIADADTGYGGLLNVRHTVQGYEAAGVAAIQLEDQGGAEEMRPHPGAAGDPGGGDGAQDPGGGGARTSPDFLIIARTDARSSSAWPRRSAAPASMPRRGPTSCSWKARKARRR